MVISIWENYMHIQYRDKNTEKVCKDLCEAKKKYTLKIANKLMKAINYIEAAESLQDIIEYTPFNFHDLKGKRKGQYAIDIDGRSSSYRIILKPIVSDVSDIYVIAKSVEIILVWEVSKHYE